MIDAGDRPLAAPGGPVLRARALSKTYGSGETAVHALRAVDLDVRVGEFIVLLGASGSGKSTLLNILGGLDRPTSGAVSFLDEDLTAASDDMLRPAQTCSTTSSASTTRRAGIRRSGTSVPYSSSKLKKLRPVSTKQAAAQFEGLFLSNNLGRFIRATWPS